MLTVSERKWLEQREKNSEKHRGHYTEAFSRMRFEDLGYSGDLWDALEFSERVAAKLARWENEYHKDDRLCPYGDDELDSYIPLCHCTDFCKDHPKLVCTAAKLAWVRIAVEEEMDG